MELRVTLAPTSSSPGQARRFVNGAAGKARLVPPVVEVLELLTSELVTNAVVHGQPPIELRVSIEAAAIRISVLDGSDDQPRPRSSGPGELGGRGLALLEALSHRWHADPNAPGPGKTVWFELDRKTLEAPGRRVARSR